jgi:hypothetical protein
MSLSHPKTTFSMFRRRSSGVLSGPSSVGRNGTSLSLALVNGKRSISCVFFDSSGLRRTSLRRAELPYRDEAAEEVDRMEMLSRDVPAKEDVPEENTVPEVPLLEDFDEFQEGLS